MRSILSTCRDSVRTDAVKRHTPAAHASCGHQPQEAGADAAPLPRVFDDERELGVGAEPRPTPERDDVVGVVGGHPDPRFVSRRRLEHARQVVGGNRGERREERA